MKKFAWAVGLVAIGFLTYNVFSNFFLDFTNINVESLRERFSEINFIGPGNDFGGSIFRLDAKNLSTGFIIEQSTGATYSKKSCMTQVRGIYYNNQRGLRLRPLDTASLTMLRATSTGYNDLQMTGGFYRDCTTLSGGTGPNTGEIYSVYGYIQYTLTDTSGSITSSLAAGVKLNYPANAMMTGLTNNLQYFNNVTPLGYIYDSNGGIGFIGGRLTGHANLISSLNAGTYTINDAFTLSGITIASTNPSGREFLDLTGVNTAQDTLWKLMVQGTLGLSKSFSPQQRLSLLGNPEKRTVIYGGTEINSSTILNLARKNAQNLCRGKTRSTNITTLPSTSDTILCINNSPNLAINLNTDGAKYQNKTLILQDSNVILNGSMQGTNGPAEIFIDKGNLFIKDDSVPPYTNFNIDGFATTSDLINSGMFLKGNFIVYGLIMATNGSTMTGFNHKLHIEGKVVSLNSPSEPSQGRIDQVTSLFATTDYNPWISLERTFIWSCGFDGFGSDLTPCSTGGITSLVPLIILNGNFAGNLLQ